MKKIILSVLMLGVMLMVVGSVSAATLTLENKDSSWDVIVDGTYGELEYDAVGSAFVYSLTATGLTASTSYSLIYYADPWPGDNPGALIGTGTSDGFGDLTMSGSPELDTMLPHEDDVNFADGAKIWLVLSSDYSEPQMTAWNPDDYLFEDELIVYSDTDEACVVFVNPESDGAIKGDELEVEWTYDSCASTSYVLQYKEGTCTGTDGWSDPLGTFGTSSVEYDWDISELDDGEYCLKLADGSNRGFSGVFIIDNTSPDVDFDWSPTETIVFEDVHFNSIVTEDGSGIDTYDWDFEDGETSALEDPTHIFNVPGTYDVVLTVTDVAGNVGTYTEEVVIEDITTENEGEAYGYEAGILGIASVLNEEFDTGLTLTGCTVVPGSDNVANVAVSFTGTNCEIDETSDLPYSERGVHELVIRATDGTTILYYDVTITVYSWWIDLVEGWNLISIPMMPEDTSINSVLENIIENVDYEGTSTYTLFQYDATNGKWYRARKYSSNSGYTGPTSYKLTKIVPGYGYWVKMNAEDTLKGFGDMTPSIGGAMLGVEVANGWNLIGHYGLDDLTIWDAFSSLEGTINYWDTISTSGNILTGVGYWMTVKFLPEETALYTPSQQALGSVL